MFKLRKNAKKKYAAKKDIKSKNKSLQYRSTIKITQPKHCQIVRKPYNISFLTIVTTEM